MGRISVLVSSGFGLGYLPKAPGTFGTLWGVVLFWCLSEKSPLYFGIGIAILFLLAVFFSHFAEKHLGSHDSSKIIIDEVLGFLVTVWGFSFSWKVAALAFILFRLFDIWKPFPVRQVDRLVPGAWGVVLDDVAAGVYANLVLRVFFWLASSLGLKFF